MSRVTPRTLKGFRDYLPDVMIKREWMLREVAGVFESFGFQPLSTPALEYTEILMGKYGAEGEKLLYRFQDQGGRDVALRYDLTVPLARVVGQHKALQKPFRRYQIAPVWRAENPQRGRFREFVQCDVDIVGSDSPLADFECIQVGVAVLKALGVDEFILRVNDRRVLDGLMRKVGVADARKQLEVLRVLDKLSKVGWDAVRKELADVASFDDDQANAIHRFLHGGLNDIDADVVDMEVAQPGIDNLQLILGWAETLGIRNYLEVDLSIARGLDYYTSTIYETFLTAMPDIGSVMSGGRYDTMLGTFSKQDTPAVGISLGVDRLLAALVELGVAGGGEAAPDVYVAVWPGCEAFAQRVAQSLRAAGLSAQLHLKPTKNLGKQFKAASKTGAPIVCVVAEDEAAADQVNVKTMATGEQITIARTEAADRIREILASA